jgi:hypothetical protein
MMDFMVVPIPMVSTLRVSNSCPSTKPAFLVLGCPTSEAVRYEAAQCPFPEAVVADRPSFPSNGYAVVKALSDISLINLVGTGGMSDQVLTTANDTSQKIGRAHV